MTPSPPSWQRLAPEELILKHEQLRKNKRQVDKLLRNLQIEMRQLKTEHRLLNQALDEMRQRIAQGVQQVLENTAKIPDAIRSYISAAEELPEVGWVRVEHHWTVITQTAGIATDAKRFIIYELEEEHLSQLIANGTVERRLCADSWLPAHSKRRHSEIDSDEKHADDDNDDEAVTIV